MPFSNPERITAMLWPNPQNDNTHLFVILDGARNSGLYTAIQQSECEFECLYRGELDPDLAAVAPYLVRLERDKPFVNWLIDKGWGDSWGVFLHSTVAFRDLKRHLRKFLMVYDADAKPLYFRYYDPRVLRIYLPTCTSEELATVFGPIHSFLLEDSDPNILLHFISAAGKLEVQKISLMP